MVTDKKRRQLHQSGVEMAARCGAQFEYRYVRGMKLPPSSYKLCGTAMDKAVTTDLNHKIETGELEQEDVLLDVARDSIEKDPEKDSIQLDEDEKEKSVAEVIGETKDKVVRLVKAHHGKIAPTIQPSKTDRRFSINLDGWLRQRAKEMHEAAEQAAGWWKRTLHQQARYLNIAARDGLDFVGAIDIEERPEGLIVVRDSKSSKKSPSADAADDSHQLSAYSVAVRVLDGQLPAAVKLDYVIDLKKETKTMTLESKRDDSDVQKYLNRIVPTVVSIQSGNFLPAPDAAWWCSPVYCGFHHLCPYVRHKVSVIVGKNLEGTDKNVQISDEEKAE